MSLARNAVRTAAVVLPAALVVGGVSLPALAKGKPVRPTATPLSAFPAKVTNATAGSFSWATTAAGVTWDCSLDGSARTACPSGSRTYAGPLLAGTHTFVLRTVSTQNKRFATTTYSWVVDTTAPRVVVTDVQGPTSATSASIVFDKGDAVSTTCSLGTSAFTSCTSPVTVSGLVDGVQTFTVRGTDAAGNTGSDDTTWTVDSKAPNLPTVTPRTALTNASTVVVDLTSGAGETLTCALDGVVQQTCATPVTLTGLSEATHTFTVTAKDAAGNAATGTGTFTVDQTPPAAPGAVNPPPKLTNQRDHTVLLDPSDDTDALACTIDGQDLPCATDAALLALADGVHTFTAVARDRAGNVGAPLTLTWTVDGTAPSPAEFLTGPARPSNDTNPVFDFDTFDDTEDGFLCSLDGATPALCLSGDAVAVSGEGRHVFDVIAYDLAGNRSTASYAWTLDTVAPAAPAAGTETVDSSTGSYALAFTPAADARSTTCSLDGAAAVACSSPYAVSGLAVGDHSVVLTSYDAARNASAPLTRSVTIAAPVVVTPAPTETAAPAPTETAAPAPTETAAPAPTGTAAPAPTETAAPAPTETAAPTPTETAAPAPTETAAPTPVVTATDSGSEGAGTQAPAPVVASGSTVPTSGAVVATAPTLVFTAADPAATTFLCSVDGAPFVPCTSPFTPPAAADGAHTVTVVSNDGTTSSAPLTYSYTLDTTAPKAAVVNATTLLAPVRVVFDEDVLGVTAGSVLLGTPGAAPLAPKVGCLSAAAAVVPCTGAVRTVVLTPAKALVPGQRYAATVTSAVHDAAGNAAVLAPVVFRAQLLQQEDSAAATPAWRTVSSASAFGSRYAVATLAGASASYPFTGTAVTWYTVTGKGMGTARVYVDGVLKGTVNGYSATPRYKVGRAITRLAPGAHVLKVVATGAKGSTAGTGTAVAVDAVRAAGVTVANPVLTTSWGTVGATPASGRRYAVADVAGEAFTMTFRGTRLTWTTVTGRQMGKARVYVDGVLKGTYDGFATSTRYGVRRAWALADKVHTVKIVVVGAHRTGATGNRVAVDALAVG